MLHRVMMSRGKGYALQCVAVVERGPFRNIAFKSKM